MKTRFSDLILFLIFASTLLISCGKDKPTEPEPAFNFDSDSVDLAPLLNTQAGRQFVQAPWDVNGDGQVNLFDLILVAQHFGENAEAPDIDVPVEGMVGETLSNGLYEVTIHFSVDQNNQLISNNFFGVVKNLGNQRPTYISNHNFRIEPPVRGWWHGRSYTEVHRPKLELMFPGEVIIVDIGQSRFFRLEFHVDDRQHKLIFQVYKDVAFTESTAIPFGEKIGKTIVFNLPLRFTFDIRFEKEVIDALNVGKISPELREAFQRSEIPLSNNLTITARSDDNRVWFITDEDTKQTYLLRGITVYYNLPFGFSF